MGVMFQDALSPASQLPRRLETAPGALLWGREEEAGWEVDRSEREAALPCALGLWSADGGAAPPRAWPGNRLVYTQEGPGAEQAPNKCTFLPFLPQIWEPGQMKSLFGFPDRGVDKLKGKRDSFLAFKELGTHCVRARTRYLQASVLLSVPLSVCLDCPCPLCLVKSLTFFIVPSHGNPTECVTPFPACVRSPLSYSLSLGKDQGLRVGFYPSSAPHNLVCLNLLI